MLLRLELARRLYYANLGVPAVVASGLFSSPFDLLDMVEVGQQAPPAFLLPVLHEQLSLQTRSVPGSRVHQFRLYVELFHWVMLHHHGS
jgi:hypothetical protein